MRKTSLQWLVGTGLGLALAAATPTVQAQVNDSGVSAGGQPTSSGTAVTPATGVGTGIQTPPGVGTGVQSAVGAGTGVQTAPGLGTGLTSPVGTGTGVQNFSASGAGFQPGPSGGTAPQFNNASPFANASPFGGANPFSYQTPTSSFPNSYNGINGAMGYNPNQPQNQNPTAFGGSNNTQMGYFAPQFGANAPVGSTTPVGGPTANSYANSYSSPAMASQPVYGAPLINGIASNGLIATGVNFNGFNSGTQFENGSQYRNTTPSNYGQTNGTAGYSPAYSPHPYSQAVPYYGTPATSFTANENANAPRTVPGMTASGYWSYPASGYYGRPMLYNYVGPNAPALGQSWRAGWH